MLHEVFNVVAPLVCGAIIVFQGFKYRQLKQKLKIAQITPGTVGYLREARRKQDDRYNVVVLVLEDKESYVLYGRNSEEDKLVQEIQRCSLVNYGFYKLPSKEEFLVKEKQNLIEERKKLLLMEKSLAKKEQAIIEMEVQQELDS